MNKTLFFILLGVGAGFALSKLLDPEKGRDWREKISDILSDVGEDLKERIMGEINKFEGIRNGY